MLIDEREEKEGRGSMDSDKEKEEKKEIQERRGGGEGKEEEKEGRGEEEKEGGTKGGRGAGRRRRRRSRRRRKGKGREEEKERRVAASRLYIEAGSRSYRTPSVVPAVDTNLRGPRGDIRPLRRKGDDALCLSRPSAFLRHSGQLRQLPGIIIIPAGPHPPNI